MNKFRIYLIAITTLISCNSNNKTITLQTETVIDFTKLLESPETKPFQPTIEKDSFLNQIRTPSLEDDKKVSSIIHNGFPFSLYWQSKDRRSYVFHPMVFGRHLFHLEGKKVKHVIKNINLVSTHLPQGGMAFYYPEHYHLNRMLGPDIHYSAISQSEILAGMGRIALKDPQYKDLLAKVADALFYEYAKGGVSLNEYTLLEIPLFRSHPEIILNGWLHALLHVNDYIIKFNDKRAERIYKKNISFLVKLLANNTFFNEEYNISNYSDSTPYKVKLFFSTRIPKKINILYKSKYKEIPSTKLSLETEVAKEKFGSYDNHITSRSQNIIQLFINCSKIAETIIASKAEFEIIFRKPSFSPTRSTPLASKEVIKISSVKQNGYYVANIESASTELFCGYPTNFSKKNNKNQYHVQHIVAMLYLANNSKFIEKKDKDLLISTAKKWYKRTSDIDYREISNFTTTQRLLDGLNRGKLLNQETSAKTLFEKSGIVFSW